MSSGKDNKQCDLFGTGFSFDHEMCLLCDKMEECMQKTTRENHLIRLGIGPRLPKTTSPQLNPFLRVTKPIETIDEIVISFRFDKAWLKKILGWNKTADVEFNAKLLLSVREKLRKQFANRPEILDEIDRTLEGF